MALTGRDVHDMAQDKAAGVLDGLGIGGIGPGFTGSSAAGSSIGPLSVSTGGQVVNTRTNPAPLLAAGVALLALVWFIRGRK